MQANKGRILNFLKKKPAANPRAANPPIMNGILMILIYKPPIAPVRKPAHGPASMLLMNIGI